MHYIINIIQGILSYRCTLEPQRKNKTLLMCMISQGLNVFKYSDQKQFSSMFMLKRSCQTLCETESRIGAVIEGMWSRPNTVMVFHQGSLLRIKPIQTDH